MYALILVSIVVYTGKPFVYKVNKLIMINSNNDSCFPLVYQTTICLFSGLKVLSPILWPFVYSKVL